MLELMDQSVLNWLEDMERIGEGRFARRIYRVKVDEYRERGQPSEGNALKKFTSSSRVGT